jgi:hypothetical protein
VAKLPPEVDADISHAAEDLGLDRLVDLMSTVQQVLAATASIHNRKSELFLSRVTEPFLQSIEALSRLRAELNARVVEHGQLQNLDKELRALYVWKELTGDWWRHVRCARDHLVAPYSPELGKVIPDLESVESDIETALARNDEPAARKHLGEYFYSVSSVFRRVDTALKDVCLRLGAVSQSLEAVLEKV